MGHEQEKNAAREKQIATLDKIETALEELNTLLQARGALTPDKQRIGEELVIRVHEKKLALLRERNAQ